MAPFNNNQTTGNHGFTKPLIISIILHAVVLCFVPNIKFEEKPPEILTVELAAPQSAQTESTATTSEPQTEAPPEPLPETPKPKLKPDNPEPKPTLKPTIAPSPQKSQEPPAESAAPPVMTAAPKADAPSVTASPAASPTPVTAPEPPKPTGPSTHEIEAARNRYGSLLFDAISKYKQYPRMAQMRGWEGEVTIEIQINGNGDIISTKVIHSSNYAVLDQQALEMVKKSLPLPPPPDTLRGRAFTIIVPIPFKLEE
ncbi:hypothetical protein A7981_02030 [Methylovorus sp. MM2]|uniref:energy transducer TonB n=1 Tax=Methylovorus sp. MM2 TaxID=1848038 RepID=UPI0007DFA9C6|nr:energy transducer TonB [Methylovorus sp. MM2]OAM52290.1 hypothetical protein A7981_02030 [Methylovorus sp. MM2]